MKKTLKKVHVDGSEWHYLVSQVGNCRIFPPHSKSPIAEAHFDEMPEDAPDQGSVCLDGSKTSFAYTHAGWRPGRIKLFIEKVLADYWKDGSWVADGKPVLQRAANWHRRSTNHYPSSNKVMEKWYKCLGWITQ
jgi:hypothetical protein